MVYAELVEVFPAVSSGLIRATPGPDRAVFRIWVQLARRTITTSYNKGT